MTVNVITTATFSLYAHLSAPAFMAELRHHANKVELVSEPAQDDIDNLNTQTELAMKSISRFREDDGHLAIPCKLQGRPASLFEIRITKEGVPLCYVYETFGGQRSDAIRVTQLCDLDF